MLAQIHSLVYWVGVLVPEQELVRGAGDRPPGDGLQAHDQGRPHGRGRCRRSDDSSVALRTKEHELEGKLAHDPHDLDTAKAMLEEIRGLLKAIDDLRAAETPRRPRSRKQACSRRIEDAKRWQKFVEADQAEGERGLSVLWPASDGIDDLPLASSSILVRPMRARGSACTFSLARVTIRARSRSSRYIE